MVDFDLIKRTTKNRPLFYLLVKWNLMCYTLSVGEDYILHDCWNGRKDIIWVLIST
jgi:hypothetical protein